MQKIRQNTLSQLKKLGLSKHIPLPMLEDNLQIRPKIDVANRINILHLCYALYLRGKESHSFFYQIIQQLQLIPYLTHQEVLCFQKGMITDQNLIDFSWCKESIKMFLGMASIVHENLYEDFTECDFANYYAFIPPEKPQDAFINSIILKVTEQISRYLDFYYCFHWHLKHDTTDKGILPIQRSVIIERRKALEWLTHPDVDWNSICLDT
ncbi:MAG: DUF4272 domain-containing protein [Cytophagales bacterium]|nr:MAG: DUF4272 domain-containing protein [Cytophagales bacterium]